MSPRIALLPAALLTFLPVLRPPEIHSETRIALAILAPLGLLACLVAFRSARRRLISGLGLLTTCTLFLAMNTALALQPHGALISVERIALAAAAYFLFKEAGAAQAARSRKQGIPRGKWTDARGIAVATLSAAGFIAALVAAAQWLYGFDALADALREGKEVIGPFQDAALARVSSGRVFGPLILPGSLAGLLSLTLPATVALVMLVVKGPRLGISPGIDGGPEGEGPAAGDGAPVPGWVRWALAGVLALAALLQFAALTATGSIAGITSFAVAAALTIWIASKSTRLRIGLASAVLVAAVAVVVSTAGTRGIEWTSVDDPESPITLRLGNWKAAGEMIAAWPLLGTGGGGYAIAYPEFREDWMNESRHAHNSYLEMVVEYGPAALPSILLFVFFTLAAWRAACREGAAAAVAAIGLPAFLMHNIVDFTFYQPAVLIPFAALAGAFQGQISPPPSGRKTGRRIFLYALLVAAAWGIVSAHAVADSLADLLIDRSATYQARMMPDRSMQAAERAALLSPLNPIPLARQAALHLAAGEPAEASMPAEKALSLDRHTANLHFLSGLSLQGTGRLAEAYVRFCEAERLYPLRTDYRKARRALEKDLPEVRWKTPEQESGEVK